MTESGLRDSFTIPTPLLLSGHRDVIKLEIKPYLQPFERELAFRELKALLNPDDIIIEEHGYWLVKTKVPVDFLRIRLTFWQRVGLDKLEPTLQKTLEFTQNGSIQKIERGELHRARRLRYGPHDLHEYRGKFFPQLVRSLINVSGIPNGSLVLDPMCGSGTTSCEAVVAGMSSIGADLNPLSVLISSVKSLVPIIDPDEFYNNTFGQIKRFKFKPVNVSKMWSPNDLTYLNKWFDPNALAELASIIKEIEKIEVQVYSDFFRLCLSNTIRSVSWQKAADLRVRKEICPYELGTAQKRFLEESKNQINRIYPYLSVLQKKDPAKIDIRKGNSMDIASIFPEWLEKVDLLITSPPYATALPYLDTDRLSLIVLGLLPRESHAKTEREMVGTREVSERERREAWGIYESRKKELPGEISNLIDRIAEINHAEGVGFRRRNLPALLGKYFLSMLDAMRSAHKMMKKEAPGYYIVGNNSTEVKNTKIEIPTDNFLFLLGEVAGWNPIEKIPMELITSRDIFRENRGSSETILYFRA